MDSDSDLVRYRPPSCATTMPEPGQLCISCRGRWWWSECDPTKRRGWRCSCCHTPCPSLAIVELET